MGPQLQRIVQFYGDELIAVQMQDSGTIFVPLARLCENLGIERKRQAQRLREHPVLGTGFQSIAIDTGGGTQETQCLRIDLIPLWLSGVNANRVNEAVREKLIRYQAEVATVLWQAFKHDIVPAGLETSQPDLSGAQMAYEIATAVQHLARQQIELEQRLGGRLDKMAQWARSVSSRLEDIDGRVSGIELRVSTDNMITEQQAAEIALAVKAVGHALAARGTKPGYSQVYGELYRRYGISSYKSLPQHQYAEVLAWLHAWHTEIGADTTEPGNTGV